MNSIPEILAGIVLAAITGAALRNASPGMRVRILYPALLIVIAGFYVLFSVFPVDVAVVTRELAVAAVFSLAAFTSRHRRGLFALALAAHGVFDAFHAVAIDNPGVPSWWPAFCGSYDVTLATWIIRFDSRRAR